jgi:hypothetical protein
MYISVGTVLVVLLCLWVAYGLIPELNRASEERRQWKEYEKNKPKLSEEGVQQILAYQRAHPQHRRRWRNGSALNVTCVRPRSRRGKRDFGIRCGIWCRWPSLRPSYSRTSTGSGRRTVTSPRSSVSELRGLLVLRQRGQLTLSAGTSKGRVDQSALDLISSGSCQCSSHRLLPHGARLAASALHGAATESTDQFSPSEKNSGRNRKADIHRQG